MQQKITRHRMLLAAIAAALPITLLTLTANAQYQVGSQGHERDANPGLNSGGYNGTMNTMNAPIIGPSQIGQNIVQNNVTQGRGFQGNLPSGENPTAFRGAVPTAGLDNFVQGSTGVPQAYTGELPPNTPTLFFPVSRFVPPPASFAPSAQVAPNNAGFVPGGQDMRLNGDARLGLSGMSLQAALPAPGMQSLPGGEVSLTSAVPAVVSQTALYGFRSFGQNPSAAQNTDARFDAFHVNDALDQAKLDPQTLQRLRDELQSNPAVDFVNQGTAAGRELSQPAGKMNTGASEQANPANGSGTENGNPEKSGPRSMGAQPANELLPAPYESPAAGQLTAKPTAANIGTGTPGDLNTQAKTSSRLIVAPVLQSSQYAELDRRLKRYYSDGKTELDRALEVNAKNALAAATKEPTGPSVLVNPATPPGPKNNTANIGSGAPGTGTGPGMVVPQRTPEQLLNDANVHPKTAHPEPLNIKSLADGFKPGGLREMLLAAENLTKDGKYAAAIDSYETAEQVAPNNPLILIGRANAELGASYFGRAENHLKTAFAADKALLMAKFDLKGFLGEQRLTAVIKELKDIAAADDKSPAAPFLLAYVAYNTGSERKAAGYMDLAEKRSGGKDAILKVIREHWGLDNFGPAEPPTTK